MIRTKRAATLYALAFFTGAVIFVARGEYAMALFAAWACGVNMGLLLGAW